MKRLKIMALIAAAGKSTRLGFPKALLSLFGEPLVIHSARIISSICPQEVYVTLPPDLLMNHALISPLLLLGVKTLPNQLFRLGYLGSVRTVLLNHAEDVDGIIICPVDSPLFSRSLLLHMVSIANNARKLPLIIVPHFHIWPGHPVYFSRHFFLRLKSYKKSGGLRAFIEENWQCARALYSADARILFNVNSKNDVKTIQTYLHSCNQIPREY